jgi:2-dehydropantoate 2-reductase
MSSSAEGGAAAKAMHVVVLGAGGLGSILGACLAETGHEVTLITRARHAEAISRDGLIVTGLRGDRVIRESLRAVTSAKDVKGAIDLLILATKARDTQSALASAESIRGRMGSVLSVQNAIEKDRRLADWAGSDRVVRAATTEAATMVGDGQVRHVGTAPTAMYLCEMEESKTSRSDALARAFSQAGVATRLTDDITHVQWEKLLQITIVSAFSTSTLGFLPDASFAQGISVRPGAEHYVAIARELMGVYLALGYEPQDFFAPYSRFKMLRDSSPEQAIEDTLEHGRTMLAAGVVGRPSLHEDVRNGRPSEIDEQLGTFVAAADRLGLEVPTARGCLRVIRALEALARPRADEPAAMGGNPT